MATSGIGAWIGVRGKDGYVIPFAITSLPSYVSSVVSNGYAGAWVSNSTEPRALTNPSNNSIGYLNYWYNNPTVTLTVTMTGTSVRWISVYFVDGDSNGRNEWVVVTRVSDGVKIASAEIMYNHWGQWLTFCTNQSFVVTVTGGNPNVTINGIFFDSQPPVDQRQRAFQLMLKKSTTVSLTSRWQSKPPPGIQVDWNNPITNGLLCCWALNEGAGNVAQNLGYAGSKYNGTLGSTSNINWTGTRSGRGFVSSQYSYFNCGIISELSGATQATVLMMGCQSSGNSMGCGYGDQAITTRFGIHNRTTILYWFTASNTSTQSSSPVSTEAAIVMVFDGTQSNASNRLIGYVNGVPQSISGLSSMGTSIAINTSYPWWIGNQVNVADNAYHELCMIWLRPLTPAEVSLISANPWQVFKPRTLFRSTGVTSIKQGSAALTASTTISPKAAATYNAIASLLSSTSVTPKAAAKYYSKATLVSNALIPMMPIVTHNGKASLILNTTITLQPTAAHNGVGNLLSVTSMTAKAAVQHAAKANLLGLTTIYSPASVQHAGIASLKALTTCPAEPANLVHAGKASMLVSSTLIAKPQLYNNIKPTGGVIVNGSIPAIVHFSSYGLRDPVMDFGF